MKRALSRGWDLVRGSTGFSNALLLVADRAGWILDEVADELQSNLPPSLNCRVTDHEWRSAKRCTIHFINRVWAWTPGALDGVDVSNRLIGLWWHGRLDSPEPAMQTALRRLTDLHSRFAAMQVTCSIARHTLATLGVPPEKIVTLPEGVNLEMFRPADEALRRRVRQELGIPADTFVVGSFQKDGDGMGEGVTPKLVKGPDVLVDVLQRLSRRGPVMALVPGPARGYVKNRLAAAGVPFVAPGFVPRADVARLYAAVDMYLSPSRDEGGPAGVLESMACGVPVVSTRSGMPADLLTDGTNGFLADVDDVTGLVERGVALMEDPDLSRRMAEAGRETIQPLDWRQLAPRYARELYGSRSA